MGNCPEPPTLIVGQVRSSLLTFGIALGKGVGKDFARVFVFIDN